VVSLITDNEIEKWMKKIENSIGKLNMQISHLENKILRFHPLPEDKKPFSDLG